MRTEFKNANAAFNHFYNKLDRLDVGTNGTSRLINVGFYIKDPTNREICSPFRKWSEKYAQREWLWYMSGNRSVEELKKHAPIWDQMHNGDNLVNSNYGALWQENGQLDKCIKQIEENRGGDRQIWLTLFDGKRKDRYEFDTPCTLNIGFEVENGKLHMRVYMRSNDIWYGFCNDQYCFSMLQEMVAARCGLKVGWYYHHVADLHLYEAQMGKK